jgi:small subunit ribosomal protein S6
VSAGLPPAGGELHGKSEWGGKPQFAYPINKKPAGHYMVAEIVAPPGSLDELERALRLADDVVRHKLIRLPDPEAERRGMAITAA